MEKTAHWGWFLARRALVWTIWGALFGAIWGAICIGVAGFLVGVAMDWRANFNSSSFGAALVGVQFGLVFGGISGASVGTFSWLIWSLTSEPSRNLIPPRDLNLRMLKWFALGALSGLTCYFSGCFFWSLFKSESFLNVAADNWLIALFGVPAAMILAQILSLFLSRRRS